ncbi:MAG: hypothetical protein Q9168_007560, partial [Polycauliona sp. 1 TL-2023]
MTTKIPKPPGLPLLGNISDVDPSNTWVSLQKLWEKYGEIFKITVLGQDIVFVANTALCDELCDEKRFRKYVGGPIVEIRKAVHASLFTAFDDEPIWGVHHRILAPNLTPVAASEHFNPVHDVAVELTTKWRGLGGNSTLSAIEELNRLDLETTTLCFFGRRLHGLTGVEPPMIKAMDQATGEAIKRPTRPKLVNWLLHQSRFDKDCKTMRQYAAECLQYRKDNPTDRKDLLYAMMNGKDPETGKAMDEKQIIDEMVSVPIGSSTAPCVIASAIYYLLQNPECIGKAREEIDSVIGESDFSHEDLEKLPYCAGIVRETLRLSAAAPGFNIEPVPGTKGPVLLGGGKYQVSAKQMMIIVLHGVNRDPAVFEEPEAFKPERMMGEAFERLPEGAKKWFGNGKRECIGRHYAWMWNVIVLVTLLKDVDFEMADAGYQLKQDGWFNLRPVGFNIKIQPCAVNNQIDEELICLKMWSLLLGSLALVEVCSARPGPAHLVVPGPSILNAPSRGFPANYLPIQVQEPSYLHPALGSGLKRSNKIYRLSSIETSNSANLTLPIVPDQNPDFRPLITYDFSHDRPKGFDLAATLTSEIYTNWRDTANQRIVQPSVLRHRPFTDFLHTIEPTSNPDAVLNPLKLGLGYCLLLQGAIQNSERWPGHISVRMLDVTIPDHQRVQLGIFRVDNSPAANNNANAAITPSPVNDNITIDDASPPTPGAPNNTSQLTGASTATEKRWLTCWAKVLFFFTRHPPSALFTDDPHLQPSDKPTSYYWPCGNGKDEMTVQIFPAANHRLAWDAL